MTISKELLKHRATLFTEEMGTILCLTFAGITVKRGRPTTISEMPDTLDTLLTDLLVKVRNEVQKIATAEVSVGP